MRIGRVEDINFFELAILAQKQMPLVKEDYNTASMVWTKSITVHSTESSLVLLQTRMPAQTKENGIVNLEPATHFR